TRFPPYSTLFPYTTLFRSGRYVKSADYKTNGRFPVSDPDGNWWIPSGIVQYPINPAQSFYLPDRYVDPFGTTTTVKLYSDYFLRSEEHSLNSSHLGISYAV